MKALRLHSFTDESIADVLRVEDIEPPVVESPDEVIVRIGGAGVCRTDLHILEGLAIGDAPVTLPHVLGHENAGTVEAVGSRVTSVEVGEAVLCYPFLTSGLAFEERYGREHRVADRLTPGITVTGGYAELLKINERSVVKLPEGSDPADYAPLADAGLAAYRACKRVAGSLVSGQTVMVVGAGGLGHLGLQILKALGPATVVVVEPRAEARALAARLGADRVHESVIDAAERPAAVVDFVGSDDTVAAALEVLPAGGTLMVVGVGGSLTLSTQRLVEAELTISGSLVGTYTELVELVELVKSGRVEVVTSRYPLDRAAEALSDLREGKIVGRAVLIP